MFLLKQVAAGVAGDRKLAENNDVGVLVSFQHRNNMLLVDRRIANSNLGRADGDSDKSVLVHVRIILRFFQFVKSNGSRWE